MWFKVDDAFPQHPKVLLIPRRDRPAAVGLWLLAGTWCAQQLTDGVLAAGMVAEMGGTTRAAAVLVEVGLWHRSGHVPDECLDRELCPGSRPLPGSLLLFHDWEDYQPTRRKVEADRAAARDRVAAAREARKRVREAREQLAGSADVPPNT